MELQRGFIQSVCVNIAVTIINFYDNQFLTWSEISIAIQKT